jgi:hypothetical protein
MIQVTILVRWKKYNHVSANANKYTVYSARALLDELSVINHAASNFL